MFRGVAAASPSVWYSGWMDYAGQRKPKAGRIYLSLGDAEASITLYFCVFIFVPFPLNKNL